MRSVAGRGWKIEGRIRLRFDDRGWGRYYDERLRFFAATCDEV